MASANLELVRSIFAAWELGDFSSAEWAHLEIVFEVVDGPTPGRWTGAKRMGEVWADMLGGWEGLRAEPEEYIELAASRVLVLIRNTGRGRTSGLELGEVQSKGANVFHLRDGLVTRLVVYWDRESALAQLGMTSSRPD